MIRRFPGRPYDIYILSDHGQTPSRPYRVEFGETLGDSIVGATKHGVLVMAFAARTVRAVTHLDVTAEDCATAADVLADCAAAG